MQVITTTFDSFRRDIFQRKNISLLIYSYIGSNIGSAGLQKQRYILVRQKYAENIGKEEREQGTLDNYRPTMSQGVGL